MEIRPYRSLLYMPGANTRALEKAQNLNTDAIIFDLEDAVAFSEKELARENVAVALKTKNYGNRSLIVRINSLETNWWKQDLLMVVNSNAHSVLIPKVNSSEDIKQIEGIIESENPSKETKIWAMIETPDGVLNSRDIGKASQKMGGLVMGTNDLQKELDTRFTKNRLPLLNSLSMCVLAAKSAKVPCIDGVYNAFKDDDGLLHEAKQGRDLGFDGKTVIHPLQLEIVNDCFSPSFEDKELYLKQIEAFDLAVKNGKGVAVLDGKIIENLHVEIARKNLALMNSIQNLG